MKLEQLAILDDLVVAVSRARKGVSRSPEESANEPIDKIVGHHRGWANKQTENAIRSDFTAGLSYDPKSGSPARSNPFLYRMGPNRAYVRRLGRQHGVKFIGDISSLGDFANRPILGNVNAFTQSIRTAQYRTMLGFNFLTPRQAMGQNFAGLTVHMGGGGSYGSALELNAAYNKYGAVGVSKRGIVDYLGMAKGHKLFDWAQESTIGYSNYSDVFANSATMARWEAIHGQKLSDAVYKLNESARSEGVWFGLNNLPSSLRGSKDLIVQPKLNIAEEFRVVHANGKAVDVTYRWGSKGARDFTEKSGLNKVLKAAGIPSGKPELLQPVFGTTAKRLKEFTEQYSRTLPYRVGALDIALTREGQFKVIEAQKRFGNISSPWVRQKIEYALTGRVPLELKMIGGAAIAVTGALLVSKMMHKKKDTEGKDKRVSRGLASKNKYRIHATSSKMGNASYKASRFSEETIRTLKEQEMMRT